jgi:ferredoxin
MKIMVDHELCEANALCMGSCSEVFHVNEDDTLSVLMSEIPERLRAQVEESVRLCPRQALKIEG